MKRVIHVIAFLTIFCLLFDTLEVLCFDDAHVSDTWEFLQDADAEPLDVLFMGNSHMYGGINPLIINGATGLNTAVLASPSSFVGIELEDLKVFLKYQTPQRIMLEATTVYADKSDLISQHQGYIFNNYDGIQNQWSKFLAVANTLVLEDIPAGVFQLLRPTERWDRWDIFAQNLNIKETPILRYNQGYHLGYNSLDAVYSEEDLVSVEEIENFWKEETEVVPLLEYQEIDFRAFLELTSQKGIPVTVIMTPTLMTSEADRGRLKAIEQIIKEYDNVDSLINYHFDMREIGLGPEDFFDEGHLNRRGASKFSEYLTEQLCQESTCSISYDNVFAYRTEHVTQLENGFRRYEVECYRGDEQYYFFYRNAQGKTIGTTGYTSQNYIDVPPDTPGGGITVRILPGWVDATSEEASSWMISLALFEK